MKVFGTGARLRVLVVDDYQDYVESTAMLLRLHGIQVDVASDCPSSVIAVIVQEPDVVLMDVGLPGCDGYAIAREILGLCRKKPLLIAVTGYGSESDHKRSANEGFDYHLVKPFDPVRLMQVLKKYADTLERG